MTNKRQLKSTPLDAPNAVEAPGKVFIRSCLKGYVFVFFGLMTLAFVFGSKLTTPLHATFSHTLSNSLSSAAQICMVCAFLLGLISVLIGYVHGPTGGVGIITAFVLMLSALNIYWLQTIAEGVNVHFASAPATRVTTKILRIEPSSPGSKSGPTLHLAYWGADNPAKVVTARMDSRIFHTDMDKRHATFHVREGFFGVLYASEYK